MIEGRINAQREAVISLPLVVDNDVAVSFEAVIDTGFNGFLTLPRETIERLRLSRAGSTRASLGDGSEVVFPVFRAVAEWHGRSREISVLGASADPVIGIAMLEGSEVRMWVHEGGQVHIEELRPG